MLQLIRMVAFFGFLSFAQQADAEPPSSVPVSDVIAAIKAELQSAALDTGNPRLSIKSVDVKLATITEKEAGAGVVIGVPVFSANVSAEAVQGNTIASRISFTLTPSDQTPVAAATSLGLVEAVRAMREGVRLGLAAEPKLATTEIVYSTDFVLATEGSAEIGFFFGKAKGSISSKQTSSITFHMKVE